MHSEEMIGTGAKKQGTYAMLNDRTPVILVAICAALFFVCPLTDVLAQNKKQNDSGK